MTLVRGWAGGIFEPADRGEVVAEFVEPAVVLGFQDDGLLTDQQLSLDQGYFAAAEAWLRHESWDDREPGIA